MKTPVHELAETRGIPVLHDLEEMVPFIESRGGRWFGVVVAYGRLIPREILVRVPLVNLHFSLLPRWRGAAPVERAILAGDEQVGVCVMRVTEALDEGDVYARAVIPLSPEENADEVRGRLCAVGTAELVRLLETGWGTPEPQVGAATYAKKITKDERRISWSDSAEHIARVVRIGGAHGEFAGQRIKLVHAHVADSSITRERESAGDVWTMDRRVIVACGHGHLVLDLVQPAGRTVMTAVDWWNGVAPTLGEARFD